MIRNQQPYLLVIAVFLMLVTFSHDMQAQTTYSKKSSKTDRVNEKQSPAIISSNSFRPDWSFYFGGGPSLFFGDTRQYRYYPVMNYESEWKFGGTVMLKRSISPVFSLRGQVLYSGLAGTRRPWKKYFNTSLIEFNLNTAINLNNLISGYRSSRKWGVDVIIGVGLVNFNTTVYQLGSNTILSKQGFGNGSGIGGRTLEGLLLGGIGFEYQLDKNWAIRFETANRALNTDKLDNHVGGFKYDIYNHSSIGLAYTFKSTGKNIKLVPEGEPGLLIVDPDNMNPVKPDESRNQEVTSFNRVIDVLELDYNRQEPVTIEEEIIPPAETIITEQEIVEIPEPVKQFSEFEYRVQIRARYGTKIAIDYLAKTYNLPAEEIMENSYNGYYIYTIGSFATYDEAATRRNQIRSQNRIYDAFVVAFRDGQRLQKLP